MREIGSEFWDIPSEKNNNGLFPESTQWFLSGRSALYAIVRSLKQCRTVAVPSWCCDSMVKPFLDAGLEVHFYPIQWKGGIKQTVSTKEDVLLVLDYFGYSAPDVERDDYKGVVIRDVTHSLFSKKHTDADYYFGSLRKWCGFWTGGYAWSEKENLLLTEESNDRGYTELRKKAMRMKRRYLESVSKGSADKTKDKKYLEYFEQAELILNHIGAVPASSRDIFQAKHLAIKTMREKRRRNAEFLRAAFPDWLMFPEMKDEDCPLFVPVLIPQEKRNELRRYLIQNDIYCPVHWPVSDYHRINAKEAFIYENELSLVCDQRYTPEDMERMIKTINQYWRGLQ